jgi:hypothetical protein
MTTKWSPIVGLILIQLFASSVIAAQSKTTTLVETRTKPSVDRTVIFALIQTNGSPAIDPIVVVNGGSLEKLPMDIRDDKQSNMAFKEFAKQYYKIGLRYPIIGHGSQDGSVTVVETAEISCQSWTAIARPNRPLSHNKPRLGTTSITNIGLHANLDKPLTDAQRSAFRRLAAEYFLKKRLSKVAVSKLTVESLESVYLSPTSPEALVGDASIKGKHAVYRVFMMADWDKGDEPYIPIFASYHVSRDVEDGTDSVVERFVDHADFDKDGTDEIVTSSEYYESWDYTIYQLKDGNWQAVYHGAGGGC